MLRPERAPERHVEDNYACQTSFALKILLGNPPPESPAFLGHFPARSSGAIIFSADIREMDSSHDVILWAPCFTGQLKDLSAQPHQLPSTDEFEEVFH